MNQGAMQMNGKPHNHYQWLREFYEMKTTNATFITVARNLQRTLSQIEY
jgi:hypothetical protein